MPHLRRYRCRRPGPLLGRKLSATKVAAVLPPGGELFPAPEAALGTLVGTVAEGAEVGGDDEVVVAVG